MIKDKNGVLKEKEFWYLADKHLQLGEHTKSFFETWKFLISFALSLLPKLSHLALGVAPLPIFFTLKKWGNEWNENFKGYPQGRF